MLKIISSSKRVVAVRRINTLLAQSVAGVAYMKVISIEQVIKGRNICNNT